MGDDEAYQHLPGVLPEHADARAVFARALQKRVTLVRLRADCRIVRVQIKIVPPVRGKFRLGTVDLTAVFRVPKMQHALLGNQRITAFFVGFQAKALSAFGNFPDVEIRVVDDNHGFIIPYFKDTARRIFSAQKQDARLGVLCFVLHQALQQKSANKTFQRSPGNAGKQIR
ncbi:hypothetical protein SDC9_90725 [bioreactor metagenome]|uniref:Uncharacterized protein n=1 Tax=bioreactor metagenome TaxID=1076179 RepID=A0A644ZTF6_9ZZZZ